MKKTEIISITLSDHYSIRLEIKYSGKRLKYNHVEYKQLASKKPTDH